MGIPQSEDEEVTHHDDQPGSSHSGHDDEEEVRSSSGLWDKCISIVTFSGSLGVDLSRHFLTFTSVH